MRPLINRDISSREREREEKRERKIERERERKKKEENRINRIKERGKKPWADVTLIERTISRCSSISIISLPSNI